LLPKTRAVTFRLHVNPRDVTWRRGDKTCLGTLRSLIHKSNQRPCFRSPCTGGGRCPAPQRPMCLPCTTPCPSSPHSPSPTWEAGLRGFNTSSWMPRTSAFLLMRSKLLHQEEERGAGLHIKLKRGCCLVSLPPRGVEDLSLRKRCTANSLASPCPPVSRSNVKVTFWQIHGAASVIRGRVERWMHAARLSAGCRLQAGCNAPIRPRHLASP